MSETKWVPLVDWSSGERVVVGEAEVIVDENGGERATGAVRSDKIRPNLKGLSIGFEPPKMPKVEWLTSTIEGFDFE
jgi:hypothetical protein